MDNEARKKVAQQLQALRKVLEESQKKVDAALARAGKADQAIGEFESEEKSAK